jgi:hypothetical protein
MLQLAALHERRSSLCNESDGVYGERAGAFDKKERPDEPIMPRISLQPTMEYATGCCMTYPNIPFKDKIYTAWAWPTCKRKSCPQPDVFQQLITEFPTR